MSKSEFGRDLSGKGAEKAGGRWNSKGVAVVYTSRSRALCVAEIAVHTALGIVPRDFELVNIEIPEDLPLFEVNEKLLPTGWNSFPFPGKTQEVGDKLLLEIKYAVIKVPSAVVQGDFNYLLNPAHPGFSKVKVLRTEAFSFDVRLFLR
ncbi:MAG: RES family NAD+ phosphorylase [Bacteroidales bacterium]|nr:RES family NAD+ phosphorylase [Bacteroidales bacterium]